MTIDRDILRRLGWSQELIEAAERVAGTIAEPIPVPVGDDGGAASATVTSDEIKIADGAPLASATLHIR